MDAILHDIRDAHRADKTTADEPSQVQEIQKTIEEAMNYEGSDAEKKTYAFLAQLGIDAKKLTPDELVTQINILKKSELLKSPISQRGKALPYQTHGKGKRKHK